MNDEPSRRKINVEAGAVGKPCPPDCLHCAVVHVALTWLESRVTGDDPATGYPTVTLNTAGDAIMDIARAMAAMLALLPHDEATKGLTVLMQWLPGYVARTRASRGMMEALERVLSEQSGGGGGAP